MPEIVNVDNFARAESNRMLAALLRDTGGVNKWMYNREPTPLDHQPVIRQNRDTLYSAAVVDASEGVTLTLVDPTDPDDVAGAHTVQDGFAVVAPSAKPFQLPDHDETSFTATRQALLELARGVGSFDHAFGTRDTVDPMRHLIASAAAWGGLPEDEAMYLNVDPGLPVAEYALTVRDVPVDAFWSISLYNAEGYFEANERNANSVNSITATAAADGSVTVHFGGCADDRPNCLPIMDGWNYVVRLYRPRPELRDGTWTFPTVEPA